MRKTYRRWVPGQSLMFPPSPREWAPSLTRPALRHSSSTCTSASKHKTMTYERMKKDGEELTGEVALLLAAAEAVDAAEDAEHGNDRRGDELPEDLRRAKDRLARIRELRAELETEAQEQAGAQRAAHAEEAQVEAVVGEIRNIESARSVDEQDDDDPPPTSPEPLPTHQVPTEKDGTPTGKAQRNFTDGDSRIMKSGDSFVQGYNAQIAVDEAMQIIVALGVSNSPPTASTSSRCSIA